MSSLLERHDEIQELIHTLSAADAGDGVAVVVLGGPGIGKTTLVETVAGLAHDRGLRVLRARGAELEATFPFGVVRQLLEPPLASLAPRERSAAFEGAAALARPLFENTAVDLLPRHGARFASLHALYWLAVNLADRGPLVMLVDDAHCGDAASLHFLEFLARRISGVPLALVLAARTGEPDTGGDSLEALERDAGAHILRPRALSAEAVARLARERLGRVPDGAFSRACLEATGGNPLFLGELLRELDAQAVEPVAEAVPLVRNVGPDAVARLTRSRLNRVGPAAVELARAIAVLGDGVELTLAAAVAGLEADSARATADRLTDVGILARTLELRFAHPIVGAAIYGELAPGERAVRHAAAASVLLDRGGSPERVAAHLLTSDPAGDERRVRALEDAARVALRRGVPENAAAYLRRALDEPPRPNDLPAVLLETGRVEYAAQEFSSGEHHLRAALRTNDEAIRCDAVVWLSRTLAAGGRVGEAIATLEAALIPLGDEATPCALELENELILMTRLSPAQRAESSWRTDRFRRKAAGEPRFEALALLDLAYQRLCEGAPAADVGEFAEQALALEPPRIDDPAFIWAVRTLLDAELDEAAAQMLEAALEPSRAGNGLAGGPVAALHRAELAYTRGALSAALTEAEAGVAAIEAAGRFHMALPRLQALRIDVLREHGELAEADAVLAGVEPAGDGAKSTPYARLLWSRGLLRLDQVRLEEALVDFTACGHMRELSGGARVVHPDWRARLAITLARLGRRNEAETVASEQLELARRFGAPRALGDALRAAALVRDGEERLALLHEAVAVLERSPARLSLAYALVDQGAALRQAGRRRAGREPLRRAVQLADRCGAAALARRARAELNAGGGRPPPRETTGLAALTPAERRVAALAARELTNRRIAQALFITEKTVEIHLTSAYRKLGIRSRAQLPDLRAEADEEALLTGR